jgi:glycine/D-amino acid oxidase-like deaminating enzyme
MNTTQDVVDCMVVGGGLVGVSLAYGMALAGARVVVIDEGDDATRASRGNFGLVLVQAKGHGMPSYARWTRRSAALWPDFARQLEAATGIDVQLQQTGGYWFGFSDAEMQARASVLSALRDDAGIPFETLAPDELRARLPAIGPAVVGGTFCPLDGHVNPLLLLRALYTLLPQHGVGLINGAPVRDLAWRDGLFVAQAGDRIVRARRVVLAAGLGNRALGTALGLHVPVVPNRGQILVTERIKPFLPCMTNKIRQTMEGSVQLGSTEEDVGMDDRTTEQGMRDLAKRAVSTFPLLARARVVRAWASLRVMTPDGFPLYQESERHPGAFVVTCHSGITLAAAHACLVAPWIAGRSERPDGTEEFAALRFERLAEEVPSER